MTLERRICLNCQHAFVPKNQPQIYCSQACAHAATRHPSIPCAGCGTLFHPKRKTSTCCSKACASKLGTAKLAKLSAAGRDPAHGGRAAEARRASLAQRRATGGVLGRQRPQARAADPPSAPSPSITAPARSPTLLSRLDLAEMQAAYGASCSRYERLTEKRLTQPNAADTLILAGQGCALRVKQEALAIFPGKTHAAQHSTISMYYPGMHSLRQILLLAEHGLLTLDAMRWCADQHVIIRQVDFRGHLIQTLMSAYDPDSALRRAQYQASKNQRARIATLLVHMKLLWQREMIHRLRTDPEREGQVCLLLEHIQRNLTSVLSVQAIMQTEAQAARVYFQYFSSYPLRWQSQDEQRIPPHWLTIGERGSPLSKSHSARHAVTPFHAALNFGYALLESQCRQALIQQGFDVTCGFLHADVDGRDSLVFDVMELHRAAVDLLVWRLFREVILHKGDFMSTRDGTVKFNPQFARFIAASVRLPQAEIDASALWLKNIVLAAQEEAAAMDLTQHSDRQDRDVNDEDHT